VFFAPDVFLDDPGSIRHFPFFVISFLSVAPFAPCTFVSTLVFFVLVLVVASYPPATSPLEQSYSPPPLLVNSATAPCRLSFSLAAALPCTLPLDAYLEVSASIYSPLYCDFPTCFSSFFLHFLKDTFEFDVCGTSVHRSPIFPWHRLKFSELFPLLYFYWRSCHSAFFFFWNLPLAVIA